MMKLSKNQKIVAIITILALIGLALLIAFGQFPPEDISGKFKNKVITQPLQNQIYPQTPLPEQNLNQNLSPQGAGSNIDWPGGN